MEKNRSVKGGAMPGENIPNQKCGTQEALANLQMPQCPPPVPQCPPKAPQCPQMHMGQMHGGFPHMPCMPQMPYMGHMPYQMPYMHHMAGMPMMYWPMMMHGMMPGMDCAGMYYGMPNMDYTGMGQGMSGSDCMGLY
ncbi:hypothetical protein [Acetivibrio saccincola]|jgi:hypothetical protein|uniref:Uncharacterized protein n=1 Tax=Acetivibrio saccincola TaxID=1677857 RepID=A0A2K9EAQ2_9FIRM|nr:hypothetical protein [Acetivibrio saccincola]AUG58816.1 hypothetical protein HVS_14825 [Acetivibrio saccincola]NLW25855.1 hypothetical protein [Acetivibrio saccincola]PQQ66085.1 hypothetical protein B9R14_04430 [Acetivibrio saccincola]HOA96298.1 hypothetical protein [Acetivibrio saccincola]HQD28963.1 hypothetical protein [Acetivibrio saccincola]